MTRAQRGRRSRRPGTRILGTWLLGLSLVPLLGLLLVLQARWLGDLAAAQHDVTSRMLQTAATRMASECQAALSALQDAVLEGTVGEDPVSAALIDQVEPLAAGAGPPPDAPAFVVQPEDEGPLLVTLDPAGLATQLFPSLARLALGPDGLDTYQVTVAATAPGGAPLYRSHDEAPSTGEPSTREPNAEQSPDAHAPLHLVPLRWRALFGDGDNRWTEVAGPTWIADGTPPKVSELQTADPPWRIELRHRAGSLRAALAQAQIRNLLLAGGLLAVVVASLALLWVAEGRARRLAEKELAFVAGVSHDLRTPLAVVRTAASNLARGVVDEPARVAEYGEIIEREATRLTAQVERVLRFGDGEAALVFDQVDLDTLLRDAVQRCQPWRDRRDFAVELSVADDARHLRADGAALTSALHNVIENAIKYGGDAPTIRVDVRRVDGGVVVDIADDGPGVAKEDRTHLFDPFYRGAAAREGAMPGSGLGLGVAREVARAHGGSLELIASNGAAHGARFRLRLPVRLPPDGGKA
ncbi:MAG: HAMP domain-containing sensor histidine kinase [Planctomycetota bacterium]